MNSSVMKQGIISSIADQESIAKFLPDSGTPRKRLYRPCVTKGFARGTVHTGRFDISKDI